MIITTEFTVVVVIVAVSACSLPVRPVGILTLFWLLSPLLKLALAGLMLNIVADF